MYFVNFDQKNKTKYLRQGESNPRRIGESDES